MKRAYYFTVTATQHLCGPGYIKVWAGSWDSARKFMNREYDNKWLMQYDNLESVNSGYRMNQITVLSADAARA